MVGAGKPQWVFRRVKGVLWGAPGAAVAPMSAQKALGLGLQAQWLSPLL